MRKKPRQQPRQTGVGRGDVERLRRAQKRRDQDEEAVQVGQRGRDACISRSGASAPQRTSNPSSSTDRTSENSGGGSSDTRFADAESPSSVTVRNTSGSVIASRTASLAASGS